LTVSPVDLGPLYTPVRRPGLVAVSIEGEIVVYAPDSDALHHLDRTASTAWARLTGGVTLHALSRQLATDHDAEPADVMRYLTSLSRTLWERGLLADSVAAPQFTGRTSDAVHPRQPAEPPIPDESPLPGAPHRTHHCRAIGHRFDVATNDPAVCEYLNYVLADLTDPAPDGAENYELLVLDQHRYVIRYGGSLVATTDWLDRALSLLLWHINTEAARGATLNGPVIHAAAAVRDGLAVLLPAPAESGKTTTVAGLVRAGFGYLTDEAVAIEPATLLPQPYPKALSIDRGSWQVLADVRPSHADRMTGQWQLPARAIRPDAAASPAPIRYLIEPAYDRHSTTRLEAVPKATMLVRLADSTFHLRDAPDRNLAVLARIVEGAECYRLTVNNLDEAVRLIGNLFSQR